MNINSYVEASSCDEAYQLLQEDKKNVVLGGGAWIRLSVKEVGKLISLANLKLDGIHQENDEIHIGAMTSLRNVETNPLIQKVYDGILSQAISRIMGISLRNLATIGGSVMGRFAFSDILPALLCMRADLEFCKSGRIPIDTFLSFPISSKPKDILKTIIVQNCHAQSFFKKISLTALDFPILNIAIVFHDQFSIACGSRPGIARLATQTMDYINSQDKINEAVLENAAQLLIKEMTLGDNLRASKSYREILLKTYFLRGMKEVLK